MSDEFQFNGRQVGGRDGGVERERIRQLARVVYVVESELVDQKAMVESQIDQREKRRQLTTGAAATTAVTLNQSYPVEMQPLSFFFIHEHLFYMCVCIYIYIASVLKQLCVLLVQKELLTE